MFKSKPQFPSLFDFPFEGRDDHAKPLWFFNFAFKIAGGLPTNRFGTYGFMLNSRDSDGSGEGIKELKPRRLGEK